MQITGKSHREKATEPIYNLVADIRRRRLCYLGHLFRIDPSQLARRTLLAYIYGDTRIPNGSFSKIVFSYPWNYLFNWLWTDGNVIHLLKNCSVALHLIDAICIITYIHTKIYHQHIFSKNIFLKIYFFPKMFFPKFHLKLSIGSLFIRNAC